MWWPTPGRRRRCAAQRTRSPNKNAPDFSPKIVEKNPVKMENFLDFNSLRGTADTLLDAASYGARWLLLSQASAAGVVRALRSRGPRP